MYARVCEPRTMPLGSQRSMRPPGRGCAACLTAEGHGRASVDRLFWRSTCPARMFSTGCGTCSAGCGGCWWDLQSVVTPSGCPQILPGSAGNVALQSREVNDVRGDLPGCVRSCLRRVCPCCDCGRAVAVALVSTVLAIYGWQWCFNHQCAGRAQQFHSVCCCAHSLRIEELHTMCRCSVRPVSDQYA